MKATVRALSRNLKPSRFVKVSEKDAMEWETKYCTNNYKPLDVVLCKGQGVHVWDTEGRKYFDFLSAYSAVGQGHNHPKIVKAMTDQVKDLSLISRAFYNDKLGQFAKRLCEMLNYDKVCPMNGGAEAVDTAIKLVRKWGYDEKKIPDGEALILCANGNFHGRTMCAITMSTDEENLMFKPMLPGFLKVEYNNLEQLEAVFKKYGSKIAGFFLEPIQGEAGIFVPDEGYLKKVRQLCDEHNILMVCDEIQTGLGRTGKLLCVDYEDVVPDVVLLGKALSGGLYPVSAAIGKHKVMKGFTPGTHGSTYGGNPIACAVSMEALNVLLEEDLAGNSFRMGEIFRSEMSKLITENGIVKEVRGKGLLNAIEFNHDHHAMKEKDLEAYDLCKMMKKKGLLCKQTHGNIIRFAPPLVINKEELNQCIKIIKEVIIDVEKGNVVVEKH